MKTKFILISVLVLFGLTKQTLAQTAKSTNLYPSNLESNLWIEKYDDKTRTIHNINYMILTDGNNTNDITGPFKVKLYLYNKEEYDATQKIYYIHTIELDYMKHMSAKEGKIAKLSFANQEIPANTYRLGIHVDADNEIAEPNENDNAILFREILVVKEKTTTTAPNNTQENPNTQTQTQEKTTDPDQTLKDEKAEYEKKFMTLTKEVAAKEFELGEKTKRNQIDAVDAKIAQLEIDIMKNKRDEAKMALERTQKTLDKKITADETQRYLSQEQQYAMKAASLEKDKNELVNAKNQKTASQNVINDLSTKIPAEENKLNQMKSQADANKFDVRQKELEIEQMKYRLEENKVIQERTTKLLAGNLSAEENTKLSASENDYRQKQNNVSTQMREVAKEKKASEKAERKEDRSNKINNTKVNAQIKLTKDKIKGKEKDLEKAKSKNKTKDVDKIEKELVDLRAKLADLEKQLR